MKKHLEKFKLRPISPSCLNLWHDTYRDPDHTKWAEHYLLNEKSIFSKEEQARMDFGTAIHLKLAEDPTFLPSVPRYDSFEDELHVNFGTIPLMGKLDTWRADLHHFIDYKTTASKTWWTQKTADSSIQFTMYFTLLWLKYGLRPEKLDCKVVVIYVDDIRGKRKLSKEKCKIFTVKKTMIQLLDFLIEVKEDYKEMCVYALEFRPKKSLNSQQVEPKVVKLNYKVLK